MNPKLPVDVLEARGKTHITAAEADERRMTEVRPVNTDVSPPPPTVLGTKKQRAWFCRLAEQLNKLGVWDAADTDELARYVLISEACEILTKRLSKACRSDNLDAIKELSLRQKELFRQSHELASSLGLNAASRARLSVQPPREQEELDL